MGITAGGRVRWSSTEAVPATSRRSRRGAPPWMPAPPTLKDRAGTVATAASPPRRTMAMPSSDPRPSSRTFTAGPASSAAVSSVLSAARSRTRGASAGAAIWATVTSTPVAATRARARSGARPTSVSSTDSGAPATRAVRRSAPRGAGSTVDSALASTAIDSARQVRGVTTARSSTVRTPPVSARRSMLTAGGASDDGRLSRSAMFRSPRSVRTMCTRRPSAVASRRSRRPRTRAIGAKRASSRSISASAGPGARSARRSPRTPSCPRTSERSKRSIVSRRPVAASIWRVTTARAMPGTCHQSTATTSTRPRRTASATRDLRLMVPACLVPAAIRTPRGRGSRRGSRPRAAEERQGLVVQAAVRREHAAVVDGRAPAEVGEAPARLLHEDLHRGDVPWLEVDLDVELGLAAGDDVVAVVVAEAARARRAVDEPHEADPSSHPPAAG